MPRMIVPPAEFKQLLRERRECGGDRFDEVWNGVYVMSPIADNEHQELALELAMAFKQAVGFDRNVRVFPGTNVSDQPEDWTKNYRCPDVAVFLPSNPAEDRGTHWLGGPDLSVEILSKYDRSRQKFAFYAKVGVRELLLVNRRPWTLELYRPREADWELIGKSEPEQSAVLESEVLPLTLRLVAGKPRPRIEVASADGVRKWIA